MDRGRILVVDDDEAIRGLMSTVCRRLGYVCETAPDGARALESMSASKFDVVLLDLMMPVLNGYEVIARMREMPSPRPVVVVITAQGERQIASLDRDVVRAVLQKPFDLSDLAAVVQDATRSEGEVGN